jgi:urease accessory protein UreH
VVITTTNQDAARPNLRFYINGKLVHEEKSAWLPQESILFSGARLERQFSIDMEPSATLTLCEAMVFGRVKTCRQVALRADGIAFRA